MLSSLDATETAASGRRSFEKQLICLGPKYSNDTWFTSHDRVVQGRLYIWLIYLPIYMHIILWFYGKHVVGRPVWYPASRE